MIDDVFMVYDSHHCIRKPLFSSVHLQTKGWCFQRFQPWRAFLKRCVFVIMYEWTVDQTEEKVMSFFKQNGCVWTGPIIIYCVNYQTL